MEAGKIYVFWQHKIASTGNNLSEDQVFEMFRGFNIPPKLKRIILGEMQDMGLISRDRYGIRATCEFEIDPSLSRVSKNKIILNQIIK